MESIIGQSHLWYTEVINTLESGVFQERFAKWYLDLIEIKVNEYAKEKGVQMEGVGCDYNKKPVNIMVMQKNCEILDCILKKEYERTLTKELVRPITSTIYPVAKQVLTLLRVIIMFERKPISYQNTNDKQ